MKQRELEACRERLNEHLAAVLYPSCERSQQRKWGSVYARGLLLEGGRKSAGAMAERLPDGNEQSMQQFIGQSTWEFRAVRQRPDNYLRLTFSEARVSQIEERVQQLGLIMSELLATVRNRPRDENEAEPPVSL